nr:hypothetical protein [Tanacetum cinerariifolium]
MDDQDEVHDSLLAAKYAKRGEESKLSALNEVIAEALADIETLETDVKILDGENIDVLHDALRDLVDMLLVAMLIKDAPLVCFDKGKWMVWRLKMCTLGDLRFKTEAFFEALMRDVCCSLRVSLSEKRRLAAELEALGKQEDAVRAFESMKEIVSHDYVTLVDLEQLLAHTQVGLGLKDGYLADVEEKAYVFVMVDDFFGVSASCFIEKWCSLVVIGIYVLQKPLGSKLSFMWLFMYHYLSK